MMQEKRSPLGLRWREPTGHCTSFVPCLLALHAFFNGGESRPVTALRLCPSSSQFTHFLMVARADRSLHFIRALPPRRPLRPARTVPCSKVHRTFSLTVTPFEFDSCHLFVRKKKRTTAVNLQWFSFFSWWRWRVTIHYHGKREMD